MPFKPLKSIVTAMVALLMVSSLIFAQELGSDAAVQPQVLTPDQLDDLVAPVALYPDELLSQTLVASTYPLEVVEAFQWMQKNPGLTGSTLTQSVQQQNWDPSVQALVLFPDVLHRLNDDVAWTTALGQAFQTQQQDVMDAVQRMRASAQQAGKLASTPQENVVMTAQDGAPMIDIEPVSPDVIYVPVYDPVMIWGPARWYPYPHWVSGLYFGFGPAINVGWFFGPGWGGWGAWGWHPGWGNHTVIVNNTFIQANHFNATNHNVRPTSVWTHDPAHAANAPYTRQPMPAANPRVYQPQPAPAVHAEVPRNAPEQRSNARPAENPRPAPVARPEPAPVVRPEPAYRPAPAPRPAPVVRPEPAYRPAPAPRPEPAFRPAPAPRTEAAPAPRPAPAFRPAPAPAFHAAPSGGGGRRR